MTAPETRPKFFPRILHIDEVGSTNAEALRLAQYGEMGPVWIRAARQTEGKGRSGRQWASEPGNLFASLLMRLNSPARAYQLSLVAGVAVIEAIRNAVAFAPGEDVRLKWPNDILVGTAKAGGILVESTMVAETPQSLGGFVAVVGIGLNLASHPQGLDRPVTHLGAHGTAPPPHLLLEVIGASMNNWVGVWAEGEGFEAVRSAWLQSAHPIGERMTINTGSGVVDGEFRGIDAEGALLLHVAGAGERHFTFGDVTLPG